MKTIILASESPRRKLLLKQLIGDNFKVIVSDYEEDNSLEMTPVELARHHAINKGRNVAKRLSEGIVISADTFVTFEGKIFGKPLTKDNAKKMLEKISGQEIEVITGYAVIDTESKKEIQGHEISKVRIGELDKIVIEAYIATGEPLDKAGAFGMQEKGAFLVESINGCSSNVVGLPLFKLNTALEQMGISIFDYK